MFYIKMFIIIFSILLNSEAFAIMRTIGLIPSSFPRDTIEFDTYREQMAIGQVIEPLVVSDQFGNVAPSISDSWVVSEDGLRITFHIRNDAVFSTGKKITAKDVEYSIGRHWKNSKSQSYPLLKKIKSIKATSEFELIIELLEPQVAILKVLSRDHLGVVPFGWTFESQSLEPFIGSGPYRLQKKENNWVYIKNSKFRDEKKISGVEWCLVFSPANINELERISVFPDFAPAISQSEVDALRKNKIFDESKYSIRPRVSFSQTLAWWNPQGPSATSVEAKKFKMSILRELIQLRRESLHFSPSFGLIPMGVSGHIINEIIFPKPVSTLSKAVVFKHPDWSQISVVIPPRLKNEVIDSDLIKSIESAHGVKINIIENSDFAKMDLHDVDVIIDRWAGGFNDPEGFLPILNQIVKNSVHSYSKDLLLKLTAASKELSWSRRSDLFRDFDMTLVKESWVVPAWRTSAYTLTSKPLEEPASNLRYTPKIFDLINQ